MNRWLQRQLYRCTRCGKVLLHDLIYRHAGFECPVRPAATKQQLLLAGRTYEPRIGK